ncbi:hypothetical protein EC973_007286 [Apophysomyces ossiformis]|uniref:Meiosis protein 5 homolog n=1 Tax=Apophysomyces ossiformis TaxID=679940 RepID=A0A8H7BUW0_9FUNG|nr:hypothetical protein EC973_007286 [Apophysomyces ossiformis]
MHKKRRITEPENPRKQSSTDRVLQRQVREGEAKVDLMKRAKEYRNKKEEHELEELIIRWRTIAQKAAYALLDLLRGEGLLDAGLDEPGIIENQEEKEKDDDMGRMLKKLHIDHELIQYSTETGMFRSH